MERRSFLGVLAGAGLIGLAGCTDTAPTPGPTGGSTTPAPPPGGDDRLRQTTADAEQQLITLYASAIATADPELGERLRDLQAQHVEHAARLVPDRAVTTSPPVPAASQPTPQPTGTASASPSAPSTRAVLAGLRRAELAALDQRQAACAEAAAPELVRSLCLTAASEAQHADVLAALRAEQAQ